MHLKRVAWNSAWTSYPQGNSRKKGFHSASEEVTLHYATMMLGEARKEIDRADAKASILLAASGVGIGALLGGLLGGSWTPDKLPAITQIVWWAGIAAAGTSIWCLSWAVYPRRDRRTYGHGHAIAYYADVINFRSSEELLTELSESAKIRTLLAADQLLQVSRIANHKYRLIRWGMRMLLIAVTLVSASLLIAVYAV